MELRLEEDFFDSFVRALIGALIVFKPQRFHSVEEVLLSTQNLPIEAFFDNLDGHRLRRTRLSTNEKRRFREHGHENSEQVFFKGSVQRDVFGQLPKSTNAFDDEAIFLLKNFSEVVIFLFEIEDFAGDENDFLHELLFLDRADDSVDVVETDRDKQCAEENVLVDSLKVGLEGLVELLKFDLSFAVFLLIGQEGQVEVEHQFHSMHVPQRQRRCVIVQILHEILTKTGAIHKCLQKPNGRVRPETVGLLLLHFCEQGTHHCFDVGPLDFLPQGPVIVDFG